MEILIVDDGSTKDRTAEIADEYEAQFPTIVRAIHKENSGHGSAVNTGIANATGLYFKVVDSDDWVKQDAYFKILDTLRELAGGGQALDMLIGNYVYEEGRRASQESHSVPSYSAGREDVHLGGLPSFYQGTLHTDALRDLPYEAASGMRTEASGAYFLCGQSVCV